MRKIYLLIIALLIPVLASKGFQQDTTRQAAVDSSSVVDTTNVPKTIPAADTLKKQTSVAAADTTGMSPVKKASEPASDLDRLFEFKVIKGINIFTIIEALIILAAGFILSRILDVAGRNFVKRGFKPFVSGAIIVAKMILWIMVFYILVSVFVTNADELLLFMFVAVLVITGISAMPVFRNFIGGLYLSFGKTFEKGDNIAAGDFKGEVQKTGWRTTIILTEDKSLVTLPNSFFLYHPVENLNVGQKEQLLTLEYEFPFEYPESAIKSIIKDAALASPFLYINGEVRVFLESSDYISRTNKYKVNLYIYDAKYESELTDSINSAILKAVKLKLDNKENRK